MVQFEDLAAVFLLAEKFIYVNILIGKKLFVYEKNLKVNQIAKFVSEKFLN